MSGNFCNILQREKKMPPVASRFFSLTCFGRTGVLGLSPNIGLGSSHVLLANLTFANCYDCTFNRYLDLAFLLGFI